MFKSLPLFLLLLCASNEATAQMRRKTDIFKAGATLGLTFSQIDGDHQYGYHKKGFTGGARGAVRLPKGFEVATELLFTQRGSEPPDGLPELAERRIFIDLNYAEVPILLKWVMPFKHNRFLNLDLYGGVSYARLLQNEIKPMNISGQVDAEKLNFINQKTIRTTDWAMIFGGSVYITRRLGLTLRHTTSIQRFYDNPVPFSATQKQKENYQFFKAYNLALGAFYDVVSPKSKKKK